MPLNSDDDNGNGIADYQESGSIAEENDLTLVLGTSSGFPPAGAGYCSDPPEAGDHAHIDRGVGGTRRYLTPDRAERIPGIVPWPPPPFYLEGTYTTIGCGQTALRFSAHSPSADAPSSVHCYNGRSQPIVVVQVASLKWEKAFPENPDLDGCANNAGRRIFPGKTSPGDEDPLDNRRKVNLVATISPPIAGVEVYFEVWDVDDPFDQNNPDMPDVNLIDNNTSGGDNRGSGGRSSAHMDRSRLTNAAERC